MKTNTTAKTAKTASKTATTAKTATVKTIVTPLAVEHINLTETLKARGERIKEGYKFEPLQSKNFEANGDNTWDIYRADCTAYLEALYDYHGGKGGISNKTLDARLNKIMDDMGISEDDRTNIIKTLGKHNMFTFKTYRQDMTDEGKAQLKAFNTEIDRIMASETLSPTAKEVQIRNIKNNKDKVSKSDVYVTTMYKSINETTFRRQVEEFIAHKLIGLEVSAKFVKAIPGTSKKWQRFIKQAKTYKVPDIESYIKADNLEGLKTQIKTAREAYEAEVLKKANIK